MGNIFNFYLIDQWTTDQDLENLFSEFGKIKNIKFIEEKGNGKSKGYAIVEFANSEAAKHAKEKVNGRLDWTFVPLNSSREIHGKAVVINYINPQSVKQLNKVQQQSTSRPTRYFLFFKKI